MTSTWYRVDGSRWVLEKIGHTARLPAIACHVCGNTWSIIGHSYPTVDCSLFPEELKRDGPIDAVAPARYRALVRRINAELEGRPVAPAATFGPLRATARIIPPAFFQSGIDLFMRDDLAEDSSVKALRLRLGRFVAKTTRSGKSFVLHELETWPRAALWSRSRRRTRSNAARPCRECGFERGPGYDVTKPTKLKASSVEGLHIASLDVAPATRFISAELKDVLTQRRPSPSLTFGPVEVVDE
jgi:hypothetical protein